MTSEVDMLKKVFLFLIIFVSLVFAGCTPEDEPVNEESISKNDFLLDTVVTVRLYDVPAEKEALIDESFALISELENVLSVHVEGSDLYKIMTNAGVAPVEVSDETMEIFKKSLAYSEKTDGKFDISAGPLISLWNINPPEGHVPTQEELTEALGKIDYSKIQIDEDNQTVYLEDEGMVANLGAIAKGFIADKVKEYLVGEGIEHAIINLGGNVLLIGNKADGTDFRIGVQDPDALRNTYLGVIETADSSLVSSGDYERYFEQDGVRYHHILDPDTGYPSETELRQVSIISPESVDGDALSTSVFLLGLEKGLELINSLEEVNAVFVTKGGQVVVTEGLKDQFTFNEDEYGDLYEVIYR